MTLSGMIQQVLSGTGATLTIFFSTLVISLPLGLLVAFARMSDIRPFRRLESNGRGARLLKKFNPIRLIMQFFISVLRGTPLMLQLIVWCYGPYYLFGIRLTPEWRIAATVLGCRHQLRRIFRGDFPFRNSGGSGRSEGSGRAGQSTGHNRVQTFFKVIFPQMIKQVLPPVTNEIITLVKDTSLAFVLVYVGNLYDRKAGRRGTDDDCSSVCSGGVLLHIQPAGGWYHGQSRKEDELLSVKEVHS